MGSGDGGFSDVKLCKVTPEHRNHGEMTTPLKDPTNMVSGE